MWFFRLSPLVAGALGAALWTPVASAKSTPYAPRTAQTSSGPRSGPRLDGVPDPWPLVGQHKISSLTEGFRDHLQDSDYYGSALAFLGDVDGDGVGDVAVGHPWGSTTTTNSGAVWVQFLEPDGRVRAVQRIGAGDGGFTGTLILGSEFGTALASIGDRDGDGVPDLVVGAPRQRSVFVLFLQKDGTVKNHHEIRSSSIVSPGSRFGTSVAYLGDHDGDGFGDIAVGSAGLTDASGKFHVLFLAGDGSLLSQRLFISAEDAFGFSLASLGDLDGDGVGDVAVGAPGDDGGDPEVGALWILFLNPDGSVKSQRELNNLTALLGLDHGTAFGYSVARLGDLDADGVVDLAVGAPVWDELYAIKYGVHARVLVLFLRADGTVKAKREISRGQGGFTGPGVAQFGAALAAGDLDRDGKNDLLVGAPSDSEGGETTGAVWALWLQSDGRVRENRRYSDTDLVENTLGFSDRFGSAVVPLGDLDGNGVIDLAIGAPNLPSFNLMGAVWILFLEEDGSVRARRKLPTPNTGIPGVFDTGDGFGSALAAVGDLDGDGVTELAVGAPKRNGRFGSPQDSGTVWILFLASDGSLRSHTEITTGAGGFAGTLHEGDRFGQSVCALGDVDGDGVGDLAVGVPFEESMTPGFPVPLDRGALWILALTPQGTVKTSTRVTTGRGGFTGALLNGDHFGWAVTSLGDLDGDNLCELVVGAPGTDDGGSERGALWVLFLGPGGSVRAQQKISLLSGGFGGTLDAEDGFGTALAPLADRDGDGLPELLAGVPGDDDGNTDCGAVWILSLDRTGAVTAESKLASLDGRPRILFATGLQDLGDTDGDGLSETAIGAPGDYGSGGSGQGALWLVTLDGLATIGFETGDDVASTPLANGQALATPDGFARVFALSSSGPNLGPAVFDSDAPPGPRGANRDLLVRRGNLLLLQDSAFAAQTVPGRFDHPGDDPDGGTLRFEFLKRHVEPHSLVLVDIDAAPEGAARPDAPVFVVLVDEAGKRRVFTVPRGWTGDLLRDGPPGTGTLDLRTLEPQRGFAEYATARENAGFDPRSVVRIEVRLAGSGALDDLCFDPYPD